MNALVQQILRARKYPHCVRCGFCCKSTTCHLGWKDTPEGQLCVHLRGEGPGDYWCERIKERPELGGQVAVGAGCSSALFNDDREIALRKRGVDPDE